MGARRLQARIEAMRRSKRDGVDAPEDEALQAVGACGGGEGSNDGGGGRAHASADRQDVGALAESLGAPPEIVALVAVAGESLDQAAADLEAREEEAKARADADSARRAERIRAAARDAEERAARRSLASKEAPSPADG